MVATGVAAQAGDNLSGLEQQLLGRKYPNQSQEQRLIRLEQKLGLSNGGALSASYRLSRVYAAYGGAISAQKKQLAIDAYNRGVDEAQHGRMQAAIAAYRRALEHDPTLMQSYNNLANLLQQQNRIDEAIELYQKALDVKPQEALLHRNLGVLFEKQARMQEAIAEYELYLQQTNQPDPPIREIVDNYHAARKTGMYKADYLADAMDSSHGRPLIWAGRKRPVRVYVQMTRPEQSFALPILRRSMDTWQQALNGKLAFTIVADPTKADIRLTLREGPLVDPHADIGHTEYTVPEDQWLKEQLKFVTIYLNTGTPQNAQRLSWESRQQQIYRMALHELGHAIGIWGHSSDPNDIMFTHPIASGLSPRDVRTVQKLYGI